MRERFELDPAHTVLGFSAKHLGSRGGGLRRILGRFGRGG